ncbi:hypothetical protein HEK616_83620 (plasmid) [Streptomyces nigrescens]|uniref:Uncharacterized protein n=1 Tax=Streptomyces nigrescens TaxID=1920 RepID=A0ABN6R926_STRNI|nr:hypothetical protein HEK616_83620 [Streptomyces nigrescens]
MLQGIAGLTQLRDGGKVLAVQVQSQHLPQPLEGLVDAQLTKFPLANRSLTGVFLLLRSSADRSWRTSVQCACRRRALSRTSVPAWRCSTAYFRSRGVRMVGQVLHHAGEVVQSVEDGREVDLRLRTGCGGPGRCPGISTPGEES